MSQAIWYLNLDKLTTVLGPKERKVEAMEMGITERMLQMVALLQQPVANLGHAII